ncbi:DUF945 domain-containing protein [bacterium]|nr:DUF945 domain-containing protein [bacterium]
MKEEILFSNEEEEVKPEPRFLVAKEIELFSQDGTDASHNSLAHKYKGICNAANVEQIFNVVGKGYKIAQHDEVFDIVEKTVKEMGLKSEVKIKEMNDGARLRFTLTFPDINIKIGDPALNDIVNMRMGFDNSYDGTTGLRGIVDGERLACLNGMKVPEELVREYHRHTQGMDLTRLATTIEKGVVIFQTKIKERWDRYYNTKIDPNKARTFLEQCHEDQVISQKYLKAMIERLDFGGNIEIRGAGQITNQWMLYNLVTEILTHECDSVDAQERQSKKMDDKINNNLASLLAV